MSFMNVTTQNLLEAFSQLVLPKNVDIEHRLYYNKDGEFIRATMTLEETFPEPFLVVSKEVYENWWHYWCKNSKLEKRRRPNVPTPSTKGYRVAKGHALLLLEPNEEYEDQYYEY